MTYPMREGKSGPIYHLATGLYVRRSHRGAWEMVVKRGKEYKRKAFGKDEEGLQRAIKAAELLATRLKLTLAKTAPVERLFGAVAQEWYEGGFHRWAPSTRERYAGILRDYLSSWEGLLLTQIDRHQVKQLLVELCQRRSPKTVELTHAVISGIFTEAIDLGYADHNPAHGLLKRILPAKRRRPLTEPDPFTRADLDRLITVAWKKLPSPFPLLLEIMAMTGMRLGEALAMHRQHLDVLNRQYLVSEKLKAGRYGPPKGGDRRLLDLEEGLVEKLEAFILGLRKEALASGGQVGYLFPGITQRQVQRAMQRACQAAQLRVRSPHDLRHTFATLLLMDHVSPAYVQRMLGHHSISMTVDIYGHWIPGEGRADLQKALRATTVAPEGNPGNAGPDVSDEQKSCNDCATLTVKSQNKRRNP
jgi:integrase